MNRNNRVDQWRRNKDNAHKLLVIRSTWDGSWVVIDYNPDVAPRKFARWEPAIENARHRALVRSIQRISYVAVATVGGDAA